MPFVWGGGGKFRDFLIGQNKRCWAFNKNSRTHQCSVSGERESECHPRISPDEAEPHHDTS